MSLALAIVAATAVVSAQNGPVAGRNVNIVGGPTMLTFDPTFDLVGDPLRAQQNEGSCAVSPRHPLHMLCGANDYRAIDLPGIDPDKLPGDAWAGVFQSRDGGRTWQSRLHPGFALDSHESVLKVFPAMADPVVRIGPGGLGVYSGIALERGEKPLGLLFVSTWIDLLAREGDPAPFKHVRTTLVQDGNAGQFIDKPWVALGTPIPGQTCTINVAAGDGTMVTQTVPRTPVYVAWATFIGHAGNDHTKISFSRSLDCGATFSKPLNLSSGNFKNQGVQLAVIPGSNTIMAAWRRGATNSEGNALIVTTSTNGGQNFSSPIAVAEGAPASPSNTAKAAKSATAFPYCPFDQGTTPYSFRTTAYPTLTAGGGRAYLLWSQRHGNCANGVARILVSSSSDGASWTAPIMVDNPPVPAHQIMPTATVAGDKLQIAWFDFRSDASGLFQANVEEFSVIQGLSPTAPPRRRHTVDVRGAQAPLGAALTFTPYPVSEYIFGIPAGETEKRQLQFNPPNVRMFKKMTVPFISDYLDSAATAYLPADPVASPGRWVANAGQFGDTPALMVWTDNRNVKLFANEDYSVPRPYQRPNLPGLGSQSLSDPTQTVAQCIPGTTEEFTGSKNQDVFIAPVLPRGWFAAPAWNNKPLGFAETPLPDGTLPLLQRAFAVFVRNVTAAPRQFDLTIANQPPAGSASFDQFLPLTTIRIDVPARSLVARTVFVQSPAPRAAVAVDTREVAGTGFMRVWLNPDPSTPESLLLPESIPPDDPDFDIANFEVYDITLGPPTSKYGKLTPGLSSTGWPSPEWQNPEWENPEWENPEWENPEWQNPEWENPEWQNPEWENPEWENPEWENPEWENGALDGGDYDGTKAIRQFRWRVENVGNTTAAYNSKVAVLGGSGDLKFQLVAYKLYTTPVTTDCRPNLIGHTQVMSNVVNLDVSVGNFQNPEWENASAAHYSLEPGEEAFVALVAVGTPQALAALQADDIILGTQPQAVNTQDKLAGQTEPDVATSAVAIVPAALPEGETGDEYPPTQIHVFGGTPPYAFDWAPAPGSELPPGLTLNALTGIVSGTPTRGGDFSFLITVTDASVPARSASRLFAITVEGRVAPNLVWMTQPTTSIGGQNIPTVRVKAQDNSGAVLPGVMITLSIEDNPSGGVLTGTTTEQTNEAGFAEFSSVRIDRGGRGYTLKASAEGAESEESKAFDVIGFYAGANLPSDGRRLHTATRLNDGRVLVVGGEGLFDGEAESLASALLYDPMTNTWSETGSLRTPRRRHTATLLHDGRVLIAGGLGFNGALNSAEFYTPDTGTFTLTGGNMLIGRSDHTATLLDDGSVLVAGGRDIEGTPLDIGERFYADIEGTLGFGYFRQTGPLAQRRYAHQAVALTDGRVAILGGTNGTSLSSVEFFNPWGYSLDFDYDYDYYYYQDSYDGAFSSGGSLVSRRHDHQAVLLPDGKILVAGGLRTSEGALSVRNTAELYDPETMTSLATESAMASPRHSFGMTLLPHGQVLIAGGNSAALTDSPIASAELFDPSSCSFNLTGPLVVGRQQHTTTLLYDGRVLLTGGRTLSSAFANTSEIYYPGPLPGFVTDAVGDASEAGSDLVSANAIVVGSDLRVQVRFAGRRGDATHVQLMIDTDQNAATGHPGITPHPENPADCTTDLGVIGPEYVLNAGSHWEGAEIRPYAGSCNELGDSSYLGFRFLADGWEFDIPLSELGDDDGRVNFKIKTFTGEWVYEPELENYVFRFSATSDYITDIGLPPGKVQ